MASKDIMISGALRLQRERHVPRCKALGRRWCADVCSRAAWSHALSYVAVKDGIAASILDGYSLDQAVGGPSAAKDH
jgi:hypothetical protein